MDDLGVKIWQEGQHRETEEERLERINKNAQYCAMPYKAKVGLAETRVWQWQDECWKNDKDYAVSVGGLDSITLLAFVRKVLGPDAKGVSISSLEDKSVQAVHKEMGVISIRPLKTKTQVLQEFGFPVISKLNAAKIERIQTPGDDSPIVKAFMTGDMGALGGFGHNEKFKLPDRYVELFGGVYKDFRPDLDCKIAPFKVSDKCCWWLKEEPMRLWQEENNVWPFLGLMQSEGGRRKYSLQQHGCNYVGKTTARSCPFNYFSRQDLLQLALDLNVHVPEIYGEIVRDPDGTLRTTKAQRTGCGMCGFGIHMEGRPNRFDRLRESSPKEWNYWMYRCCKDPDGTPYGWGRVLDYLGIGWEDYPDGRLEGQISFFEEGEET